MQTRDVATQAMVTQMVVELLSCEELGDSFQIDVGEKRDRHELAKCGPLQGGRITPDTAFIMFTPQVMVTQAVMQLYMERATPWAKLVQWQIEVSSGRKVPLQEVKAACQSVPGLRLEPEEPQKSRFVVLLERVPYGFQSFADELDDPITEELWPAVKDHIERAGWPTCSDAEHQAFVIADWIRKQSKELTWLSLGRSLAVVHQATSLKLLGKRRGRLVPYRDSEECERRLNSAMMLPTGVNAGERYVATWPGLRTCLDILLEESNGSTSISRLKPLFRERFTAELSETAFGQSTMMELLSCEELCDSFQIKIADKGRHVLAKCGPLQGGRITLDKAFFTSTSQDRS